MIHLLLRCQGPSIVCTGSPSHWRSSLGHLEQKGSIIHVISNTCAGRRVCCGKTYEKHRDGPKPDYVTVLISSTETKHYTRHKKKKRLTPLTGLWLWQNAGKFTRRSLWCSSCCRVNLKSHHCWIDSRFTALMFTTVSHSVDCPHSSRPIQGLNSMD